MTHPTETVCQRLDIAPAVCYVRFSEGQTVGSTALPYRTARGEMLIADFDAEGRLIGIELVGPDKPCQV